MVNKYKAGACTDVTGFGILGHADYLAQAQKQKVEFVINVFPVYKNLVKVEHKVQDFKFYEGLAAETSGGLLIAIDQKKKKDMKQELTQNGINSW